MVLSKEPSGWYSVVCPAMPGAISQGESRDEALTDVAEAMGLWLEVASERGGMPLPESAELIGGQMSDALEFLASEGWPLLVETAVIQLPAAVAA